MRKVGTVIGFVILVLCGLNYFEQAKARTSLHIGFSHNRRGCHRGDWGWSCYHPYYGYGCHREPDFGWGFGSGVLLGAAVGSAANYEPETAQDIARRNKTKQARSLERDLEAVRQEKVQVVRKSQIKQKSLQRKLKRKKNSNPDVQQQLQAQLTADAKRLKERLNTLDEREITLSKALNKLAGAE